jgi:Fe-S cluster assembly iron-binding protein IscA
MLTLTDNAASAIRGIVEQSDLGDDAAGLRFSLEAVSEGEAQLHVALVPEPAAGDAEVEERGAHVFLDEVAARILDDQVLDAAVAEDGEVGFSFTPQSSTNGQRG